MALGITEDGCTCHARATTDGCSEWSCMYHGRANEKKTRELRRNCPIHKHGDDLTTITGTPDQGGEG